MRARRVAMRGGRSRVEREIKKKIQSPRKISCEFYLTEFISLMFGRFTSNAVFDFLVRDAGRNILEQGY
jgi:hypothetical protein